MKAPGQNKLSKSARVQKIKNKPTDSATDSKQDGVAFPMVGVGASAGGLDAFTKLLTNLPADTGMAFILIQHLDPKHESLSADILSRSSKMPVTEAEHQMRVEPNSVYVIPPGFSMGIFHGHLNLIPRAEGRVQSLVIDFFLQALSEDLGNLAIGVVLSGTGSDGTQGLRAIKAEGGITFAQSPESSKFSSMPRAAIAAGVVDQALAPGQIAAELVKISRHPYLKTAIVQQFLPEVLPSKAQDALAHIFLLLRNQCHVDFSFYKLNTIMRRVNRRMVLHKVTDLKAYAHFLTLNPEEVKALYADILIHVTGFFRDPEAFQALTSEVFSLLIKNRAPGVPIRIWVPGCSTGEEAYSIAIALLEFLESKKFHAPIQIFATDISEQAVQKARVAEYPESIASVISSIRLSRFFIKMEGGGYKIVKAIRDLCLFSRHDVTSDPPFARIDLISCRNLLIYFSSTLQKHVIPVFHYALAPHGFLWLGKAEAIGASSHLFSLVDKVNRIYSRRDAPVALNLRFPASTYVHGRTVSPPASKTFTKIPIDIPKLAEAAIQLEYPSIVVNEELEILQLRGRTYPFIEPSSGVPSYSLIKMAHPELLRDLRMTILAARKSNQSIKKENLFVREGRKVKAFDLKVVPLKASSSAKDRFYLIIFEKGSKKRLAKKKDLKKTRLSNGKTFQSNNPKILDLQRELGEAQEYQLSLVEKFETAQEDLTAANEELQSANEELQSTNEELETAKEELQSGNEELTTVNDELQARSIEQIDTNNDLVNLLGSVEIPIVMLGDDRRVRRFTPLAGKALNLIASDIGRPLSDLRLNFTSPDRDLNLEQLVSETTETLIPQEIEVQDQKNHWFRLQVRPYKTIDNRISGVVLALVDIDFLKTSLKEVRDSRSEAERANRAKDLFLATLSHELRTPLTSILSWAEMIRSGKLDAEKIKRGIEIIEQSGKAQAQLIDDLLDVSRIVAGKLSLETREIDPISVVQAAIEAVRSTAEARSIQIETFFIPFIGTVMADPVRLQQVFWNLLTNAVKFSTPGSKVSIRAERINDHDGEKAKAVIRVVDSGKGIDAEFIPQIFDRFSQQDSSSVRVHGGLGLGLAIVRNLVELHGGSIRAESSGNQLGATFTVFLPIKSNQAPTQATHVDPLKSSIRVNSVPVRLDGIRVLIVDDEASAREVFAEVLVSYGAEIKVAESAQEALSVMTRFSPHVLVSDIAMPKVDGYELIKRVRALGQAAGGNTPALALTAYAGGDDVSRALLEGFQAHLSKPVDGQQLAKTIAKLAGKVFT